MTTDDNHHTRGASETGVAAGVRWPSGHMKVSARLASVIKRARKEEGLSLMALSRRSTVSRRAIRAIERGDGSLPNLATLIKICRVLGLTFAELAKSIDADD